MTTLRTGNTSSKGSGIGLSWLWQDQRIGTAVVAVIATLSGGAIAISMPRGPVTAEQALLLMAVAFVTGVTAGFMMRSRWAMLIAPLVFVAVFELGRLGVSGPTVDGLYFDSLFGILAFLLGRGVFALLGLLPMVLGVAYGNSLARWLSDGVVPYGVHAMLTVLMTALLLGLAVVIARPASTPAILGADNKPLAGSITTLEKVKLGGQEQWVMIRGESADNPVLLYLSGGPGQSDLPFSRVFFRDLAKDFVVVSWDQRGTGKSYPALEPSSALTLEQAVSDTLELTDYLRSKFSEEKIYLLGESWGTILGVLAVQQRPELYHAVIGSGQMVSVLETDRRLYRDVLALAGQTGDAALANQLRAYGEPPYGNVFASGLVFQHYDKLYKPYTPPQAYLERAATSDIGFWGVLGSEYNPIEKVNVLRGLLDTFSIMYPQLQGIDFRRDASRLEVPVYLLDGQAELSARRDLALEWYGGLEAPIKSVFSFENAAHAVAFEQLEAFYRIMTETVVPETYSR